MLNSVGDCSSEIDASNGGCSSLAPVSFRMTEWSCREFKHGNYPPQNISQCIRLVFIGLSGENIQRVHDAAMLEDIVIRGISSIPWDIFQNNMRLLKVDLSENDLQI